MKAPMLFAGIHVGECQGLILRSIAWPNLLLCLEVHAKPSELNLFQPPSFVQHPRYDNDSSLQGFSFRATPWPRLFCVRFVLIVRLGFRYFLYSVESCVCCCIL